jgi:hypothetical protein
MLPRDLRDSIGDLVKGTVPLGSCGTSCPAMPSGARSTATPGHFPGPHRASAVPLREKTLWRMLYETARLPARLLRLPDGTPRTSGPLFLASCRPVPARRPAARNICQPTGRARLGYDRVRVLLKKHTATTTGDGLELHQLRHSAAATSAIRRSRCS